MKKILSVVLALVMIFSCFSAVTVVFAADDEMGKCQCENCTKVANGCHCCPYCPYLDKTYLTSCVKDENGQFTETFCCGECTGIWPCECGCDCCKDNYADKDDSNGLPLLTPEQQQTVIGAFQGAMKKVAAVFDMIFKAIFDFLRLGEIFPDLVPKK